MHTVTCLVTGLSMGATVLLAYKLGEGKSNEGGQVLGSAIALFGLVALALTGLMVWAASPMARLMQAPVEAFGQTVTYVCRRLSPQRQQTAYCRNCIFYRI